MNFATGARMSALRRLCFALFLLTAAAVHGQTPPAAPAAAPDEKKPAAPTPIPIAEIAAQAEALNTRLRDIDTALSGEDTASKVGGELPALAREIDARLRENRRIVAQRPPLEMVRTLEGGWRHLRETLSEWTRELGRSASRLDRDLAQLGELEKTWIATREAAGAETPEVAARIDAQVAAIRRTREVVERERSQVLAMQGRIAAQDARAVEAVTTLRQAREEAVRRLFVKDSPAIWSPDFRSRGTSLDEEARLSFSAQSAALREYVDRHPLPFMLHALMLAAIAACFYWARREVRRWRVHEPDLERTALVFETPLATALVISLFAIRSIYPQAPRLLWALLGALTLIPTVYILRRIIVRDLQPTLHVLVVFYLIDQVRAVVAALQLLPRLLFLLEMLAGLLFALGLTRALRRPRGDNADRLRLTIKFAALAAAVVCAVTLLASTAGYVRLANLLGNTLLASAYLALVLYVVVAICDGLVMIALRVRPFALLGMVRTHRLEMRHRARRVLQWIAIALWAVFVLERLTVREQVFSAVRDVLTAELVVGSLHLSLGDLLAFAVTVWASVLVSRLVQFLLEEDVYPRVHLSRGLPYAISTMTHYVILLVGFFAAVAALGFDMTKFTILAGAFTVGVGFGLQNIFNNFVSGLILLFERPVKVGDVIEIDPNAAGVVERIGIRASIIRTPTGAQLIVPNGKLISDRFTNWTLSSRQRSIEVPVSVVLGSDAAKVTAALERIAAEHPLVSRDPPPQAIVTRLGPDWMGLELRAWTEHAADWMEIRSDLWVRVSQGLAAENVTLR